jgi:hypothetical protein
MRSMRAVPWVLMAKVASPLGAQLICAWSVLRTSHA